MSNQTQKINSSGSVSPDSYVVEQALIHPSNQTEPIDIREMVLLVETEEDIDKPYLELTMFLQDSANILSRLRLNGNEKIELKIQKEKQEGSEEKVGGLEGGGRRRRRGSSPQANRPVEGRKIKFVE